MKESNQSIVVFDLEICYWEDRRDTGDIIQMGVVKLRLNDGAIPGKSLHHITNTNDDISHFCTVLTGITQTVADKQGVSFTQAIDSMVSKFSGAGTIYSAWGRDDSILCRRSVNDGVDMPFDKFIDLTLLHQIRQLSLSRRITLDSALEFCDIQFEGDRHNAYYDALNTAKITLRILGHGRD